MAQYTTLRLSFISFISLFSLLFQFNSVNSQLPITRPITGFCMSYFHGCVVFKGKDMKCWGLKSSWGASTSAGTIGDEISEIGNALPYVDVGTDAVIDKVVCGWSRVCVKLGSGEVKCMGNNLNDQLGLGITYAAKPIIGSAIGYSGDNLPAISLGNGLQVLDIAAGYMHTCTVLVGGKVKCYGVNDIGQLGLGDTTNRGGSTSDMGDNLGFVDLGANVEVASVHSGPDCEFTCVILSNPSQRIKCWGLNESLQLGYGLAISDNRGDATNDMGDRLPLIDLGSDSRVTQLSLGVSHTCALLISNNALKCFGRGVEGQLGSGSTAAIIATGDSMPSVPIDSGKTIKLIAAGIKHTCIVYDDQVIMKCFGLNSSGQLGQGDGNSRGNSPTTVISSIPQILLGTGATKITSLHIGWATNCVVFENSAVKCFGFNTNGNLLIGNSIPIGDGSLEMGNNLKYAEFFSPTKAPSTAPSATPTNSPVPPTSAPSKAPTNICQYPTSKLCNKDMRCIWQKVNGVNTCAVFECFVLIKGKCLKQKNRCKWSQLGRSCQPKI